MKRLLLLLWLLTNLDVTAQVAIDKADSRINVLYNSLGADATGRNHYEATISTFDFLRKVTIYFNETLNRWEIKNHYTASGYNYSEVSGYNTDPASPLPPETGWTPQGFSAIVKTGTIVYTPGTRTAHCNGCNWSDASSWQPAGSPRPYDNAIINGTVQQDTDFDVLNLTIHAGKSLQGDFSRAVTLKGTLTLNGALATGKLVVNNMTELDGTLLTVKQLQIPTTSNIPLKGNLSVYDVGNPANDQFWVKGGFALGNFDITTYGGDVGGAAGPTNISVKSTGSGRLRYFLKAGWTTNALFNIGQGSTRLTISGQANTNSGTPYLLSVGTSAPSGFQTGHVKSLWHITAEQLDPNETPSFYPVFYWGSADDVTSGFNLDNVYIKRWNGASWENKAGPLFMSHTGNTYPKTVGVNGISEFSTWGIFDSEAVLPVRLAEFSATPENTTSLLRWATTEETNSDRFEIEHGTNGKQWTKIGEVAAGGESRDFRVYSFTHGTPTPGQNYYRLKIIDHDATFSYSPIRSVRLTAFPETAFYFHPNPATDRIFLRENAAGTPTVSIHTNSGQTVLKTKSPVSSGISVSALSAGSYILKIEYPDGLSYSRHLVIER